LTDKNAVIYTVVTQKGRLMKGGGVLFIVKVLGNISVHFMRKKGAVP
jgi:hypothetical protein